jgi:hypothetical protein
MAADERPVRPNEVRAVPLADGRTVVSICKRPDGLFCFYADTLEYVEDCEEDLWQSGGLEPGLFGTPDEAEAEARLLYRLPR